MARIMFATVTATGHVTPLLPIARALVARGHDVRWLCGARHAQRIAATGARVVPYRHARDVDESRLNDFFPGRAKLEGFSCIKHDIKHVFLDPSLAQLRDLEQARAESPFDLMVADIAYLGAAFEHARSGTPLVLVSVTPLFITSRDVAPVGLALAPVAGRLGRLRNQALHLCVQNVLMRDIQEHYRLLRSQAGLSRSGWFMDAHENASVVLQPSIPSLEYPRCDLPDNVHFIGMLPPERAPDFDPPAWFAELDGRRPVVHVTQGTIANSAPDLIAPALRGLADDDVLVVVTTGHRSVSELGLGKLPSNARIAPFVPYVELLPRVQAMLTNGGFGGVQMALSHGVPLAVAGSTEEKPEVAARVAYSGAGLNLKTAKPTPTQVHKAVHTLLEHAQLRSRAQALAREYERYDALALALVHIETLARGAQP